MEPKEGIFPGLPDQAAAAVRESVFAGIKVAQNAGSSSLLSSVREAFTGGVDATLWVSAGLAALSVILTLAFLPWRATTVDKKEDDSQSGD